MSGAGALTQSVSWDLQLTAKSSIAHGGEHRATVTTFRRERMLSPTGALIYVPVLSGNGLRGRLRRTAEELYREVLTYDGQLSADVVHLLRSGGSLVKRPSTKALTGSRLRVARELVLPLALFGGVVGRAVEGSVQVGKIIPHVAETAAITGVSGPSMFELLQLETYTRAPAAGGPSLHAALTSSVPTQVAAMPMTPSGDVDREQLAEVTRGDAGDDRDGQMLFRLETLPMGTTLSGWLHAGHLTNVQLAFLTDVLARWSQQARIGGRAGFGHGLVNVDATITSRTGPAADGTDWRSSLLKRREEALAVLGGLM